MKIPQYKEFKMALNGFKKVALKDTKGVLNETNNFKWVKQKGNKTVTVLPSGTRITDEVKGLFDNTEKKLIEKANGDRISIHNDFIESRISKNGKTIYHKTQSEIIKEETKKEAAKRLAQYTRDEIVLPDGRVVKRVFNQDKKLVAWTRKGNGEDLKVRIKRPLGGVLNTDIYKSHGNNKYTEKIVYKNIYPGVEETKYNFSNPDKYIVESTAKMINPKTNKMELRETRTTESNKTSFNLLSDDFIMKEIFETLFKK